MRDAGGIVADENPDLWNKFKSYDIDAMIDELVQYKKTYYPDDKRRILNCRIPDLKVRIEWLNAAAPDVDSKWETEIKKGIADDSSKMGSDNPRDD